MPKTSRLTNLDLLRGTAILMVLLYHWYTAFYFKPLFTGRPELAEALSTNLLQNVLPALWLTGYQGVHIFLFLSGFLLTYKYNYSLSSPREFIKKHWLKLLIPLYPAVLFGVLVYYLQFSLPLSWPDLANIFLFPFSFKFWLKDLWLINPPLWFVGLILQFYFFFPFLLRLLQHFRPLKFLFITGLITLIARFLAVYLFSYHPFGARIATQHGSILFSFLPTRLLDLSLGMAAAHNFLYQKKPAVRTSHLFIFGLVLLLWGNLATLFKPGWLVSDALLTIGITSTVYFFVVKIKLLKTIKSLLLLLADYSYELFLIHYPLIFTLAVLIKQTSLAKYFFVVFFPIMMIFLLLLARILKIFTKPAFNS